MRRRPLILAIATATLAATLSACDGGSNETAATPSDAATVESPSPTPTPTPTPERLSLTQEQVNAALLTPEDVGAGWVVDTSEFQLFGDDDEAADTPTTVTPANCQAVIDALDAEEAAPTAEGTVQVTTADTSAMLAQMIQTVPGSSADGVDAMGAAFAQCPSFTETDADGTVSTFTVAPFDVPSVGDASAGFNITATNEFFTLPMSVVFIADGDQQIALMGVGTDPALLNQAAAKAHEKVVAAAG